MAKIFTVRITDAAGGHTKVSVFNRLVYAGELVILTDDLDEFLRRMAGGGVVNQEIETVGPGAKVVGMKIGRIG